MDLEQHQVRREYETLPQRVTAWQYTAKAGEPLFDNVHQNARGDEGYLRVSPTETVPVRVGDWIVTDCLGTVTIMSNQAFRRTYKLP